MKLFLHALLFSLLVLVVAFPTPGLPLYRPPSPEPPPPAHPPQPARGGTPPHRQDTLSHEPAFQVPTIRWDIPNGAIGFWKSRSNPPMVISVQNNPPVIREWHWRGQNYRVHPFPRVLPVEDFNRLNCEWTRLSVANEPVSYDGFPQPVHYSRDQVADITYDGHELKIRVHNHVLDSRIGFTGRS